MRKTAYVTKTTHALGIFIPISSIYPMVTQIGLTPTQPVVAHAPSLLDQILGLGIMLVIIGVIIVAAVLLIRWLFSKKESNKDIYTSDYKKTIELCKAQKDPDYIKPILPGMPLFLGNKGVPVILNYPHLTDSKSNYTQADEERSKLGNIDKYLDVQPGRSIRFGAYAGHCITLDGCYTLMVKSRNLKILGLFPKIIILKLRLKSKQRVPDSKDRDKTVEIDVPADALRTSKDMITIDCLGIDKIGHYFYCVNKTDEGQVVDTRYYAYQDLIEISHAKQIIDIGRNQAIITNDLAKSNPLALITRKTEGGLISE